jgi:hypothetical protein
MSASRLSQHDLVIALKQALPGQDWGQRGATHLLIDHGYWLRTNTLLRHVELEPDRSGQVLAWIDFEHLAEHADRNPASSSEQAILRLACHLAGALPQHLDDSAQWRWSLRSILAPLDSGNTRLALTAITIAATGGTP